VLCEAVLQTAGSKRLQDLVQRKLGLFALQTYHEVTLKFIKAAIFSSTDQMFTAGSCKMLKICTKSCLSPSD
jgi:uncharacterized membrane protein